MASTFTSTTLPNTYFDDYDQTDNYHQILFNAGRALQARELTQLQTLIYREMGRFGQNIFKEGALVQSGGYVLNSEYEYVKIASTNAGGGFEDIPLGSTIFREASTGLEARVLRVEPIDASKGFNLDTIYVQYTNGGATDITSETDRFSDASSLTDQSGGSYELVTHTPNASGRGVRFDVGESVFFALGRFVYCPAQSIMLSNYTQSYTGNVGFKVTQEVVTVNDTTDLYDNTNNVVNRASPGADRYRITLTLTTEDQVTSDETFLFYARIENSTIVKVVEEIDAYNEINELMALRTDEESGDYVVSPFTINFEDNVEGDSNLELLVSNGIAYINGFRAESPSTIKLSVPRPQETETVQNDVVPAIYGNYFLVDDARTLPPLDHAQVNIYSDLGSTDIGDCRIRAIEKDGSLYRVYVYDVNITSGNTIDAARAIGTGGSDYLAIKPTTGSPAKALLKQTLDNDLLFPTARPRTESFSDIVLRVQRHVNQSAVAGSIDLNPELGAGESFTNTGLWIIADATGFVTDFSVSSGVVSGAGITGTTNYDIYYYVQKTGAIKSKTLSSFQTATLTKQTATAPEGTYNYYSFGVPDVFQLDSVRNTNATGLDMLSRLILDDGQRDNYYADSRLIVPETDSAPEAIYVKYKHFTRGTGDFYAPSSYNGINYTQIPDHILQDGTSVRLINYLDFRPDLDDGGTVTNIHPLPRATDTITADIAYYLPRADKLLITEDGDVQLLMGAQAENPQFKQTPDNSLELYKILMNANTLNETDLSITPVEHKGYTMKDISGLEAKLDRLEEYTTSKFTELENRIERLVDSAGDERPAVAIVIDDNTDHSNTDVGNPDHRASLDPESRLIRPQVDENNIRLVVDNTLSSNVTTVGDNVYLDYDSATFQSQLIASEFAKVNPFGMVDNVGTLKLSPSSDDWKDTVEEATRVVLGDNKLAARQALLWNNWAWNWGGRRAEDYDLWHQPENAREARTRRELIRREGYSSNFSANIATATSSGRHVNRVLSSETLRKLVNGKYVDLALIPWMRSRKVFFHAKGLTPNTKFTPFFDGQDVSDWCREESTFVKWSDRTEDIGDQYRSTSVTEHPAGKGDLISDANGEIIGSFFIPNIRPLYEVRRYNVVGPRRFRNAPIRFRCGIREFKLLDINRNDWSDAGSKCFAYYSAIGQVDKKWTGFWNLRGWHPVVPWGYNYNTAFTQRELQNTLNQVRSSAIGIVEPQLAGGFGPETSFLTGAALSGLDASGNMSQVLSDYVSVNQNQFAGTNANPLSIPQNPLAQTFKVDNQFGVVLTKINLFFRSKDSGNLPVSIHLRPVQGGKPSNTTIVPDSHVFLNPNQVTAIGTNPTLSVIQGSPTTFTFDEPVYLQPGMQYAIVIQSQSTEYEIFTATTGKPIFGASNSSARYSTTQDAVGALYLPQNGTTWVETKNRDLMYQSKRAVFNVGGGSLILKNARLPASQLDESPIRTYNGSGKIYVQHMCHGLQPGDGAQLDSCEAVNGITANQLNTTFVVDSADLMGYTVTTAGTATETGYGGGDKVLSQRNANFSVMVPQIETAIPKSTSIDASAKLTSGRYISGSATRFTQDAQYKRISLGQNVDYESPRTIYSKASEDSDLGAGISSAYIKLDLKTSNDYVSPVVDLQRASLVLAGLCVNDPEVTPPINGGTDEDPYGSPAGFQHITSPITLEEAAVGIDVRCEVNVPEGSQVKLYWRTCGADQNIYDRPWTEQAPVTPIPNDNSNAFTSAQFLVGGVQGTMDPFQQAQYKLVGVSGGDKRSGCFKQCQAQFLAV